jgi:hypothetical protein
MLHSAFVSSRSYQSSHHATLFQRAQAPRKDSQSRYVVQPRMHGWLIPATFTDESKPVKLIITAFPLIVDHIKQELERDALRDSTRANHEQHL